MFFKKTQNRMKLIHKNNFHHNNLYIKEGDISQLKYYDYRKTIGEGELDKTR